MAYRLAGTYALACDCSLICPCPMDGPPTGRDAQCHVAMVCHVREGSLDDIDLSGVNFALYIHLPTNLTGGNWRVGIVVDEAASDEQAQAIERVVSGQAGGPFADFVPLIGEFLGTKRAPVRYSDGDTPSASVGDETEFSVDPYRGGDGSPTTGKNAMFGFAPEYRIEKGSGRSTAFGIDFEEASYGESAEFEFAIQAEGVHVRA